MAKRTLKIRKFKPPTIEYTSIDVEKLNAFTGKTWHYASSGKACLFHILKALNIDGKILLPAYACDSILVPIKKLGLDPVFYDVDVTDLNPDVESIKWLANKYDAKSIVVVSLYGNPADLVQIEQFCLLNGILMIDDAAQSFGSVLSGRLVGTYGNAGFFSFSPGKATAGHMGGFFWTDIDYVYNKKNHDWIHYIKWLDFYYNRYQIYKYSNLFYFKIILSKLAGFLSAKFDLDNDSVASFENEILGGILNGNLSGKYRYRNYYLDRFVELIHSDDFKIIKPVRGNANSHKIVLLFMEEEVKLDFVSYLSENQIFCASGYSSLTENLSSLPHLADVIGKIVEMPIEGDELKMDYLFEKVKCFIYK